MSEFSDKSANKSDPEDRMARLLADETSRAALKSWFDHAGHTIGPDGNLYLNGEAATELNFKLLTEPPNKSVPSSTHGNRR